MVIPALEQTFLRSGIGELLVLASIKDIAFNFTNQDMFVNNLLVGGALASCSRIGVVD